MINYDLLSLVEKVLGKGRRTSGNNYSFFSPFISHYKPKLEIDLSVNNNSENPWHCWVSNAKGRSIVSLFKKLKVGRQYQEDLNKILKTKNLYIQNKNRVAPNKTKRIRCSYPIISCLIHSCRCSGCPCAP